MATTGRGFTALYVFGDSLSDTGNNPAPAPQYFEGRYCNGPLWVEYLSAQLGLPYNSNNNFAVSGSETSDLLSEIAELPASTNLHSGLFTVFSGGNDFLDNVALGENDAAWNGVISNAALNVTNALNQLYTDGAREVLLANLPDLGRVPAAAFLPPGYPEYVDSKVALFNVMLASAVTNVMERDSGLRIYLLDDHAVLSNVLSAPASYGFTVTTNGALEDPNLTDKSFNGPGANYLFWDSIHPTTKFDKLLGAAAFADVGVQLTIARNGGNSTLAISNLYPGFSYVIQSSTNLSNWSNYNTFTAASTNAIKAVANSSSGNVYYRVTY